MNSVTYFKVAGITPAAPLVLPALSAETPHTRMVAHGAVTTLPPAALTSFTCTILSLVSYRVLQTTHRNGHAAQVLDAREHRSSSFRYHRHGVVYPTYPAVSRYQPSLANPLGSTIHRRRRAGRRLDIRRGVETSLKSPVQPRSASSDIQTSREVLLRRNDSISYTSIHHSPDYTVSATLEQISAVKRKKVGRTLLEILPNLGSCPECHFVLPHHLRDCQVLPPTDIKQLGGSSEEVRRMSRGIGGVWSFGKNWCFRVAWFGV